MQLINLQPPKQSKSEIMLEHWQFLAIIAVTFTVRKSSSIICYKCDSVTIPACATSLDSNSLPVEECKSAFACAMTIVDSVTYRGCSTNTPRGPDYYKTCTDSLCNKGVYPPGRLKCHQCKGSRCLAAPVDKPEPCRYFEEDDQCYTDVIDEIDTFRGCGSDTDRAPNVKAVYCNINGCNNLPGMTELSCSQCDSIEGRGCKMDLFEVNNASCVITNETICNVQMLLGHQSETCFLYHNLDHVVRGCTRNSGSLSMDIEHFDTCEIELCNKKCLKQQKCIVCDSTKDERCKSSPSNLTASICSSAEASSCNACELINGTVRRGCGLATAATGARCNHCNGEGCNKLPFTKCYKCTSDLSPNCGQWANPNIIGVENCEVAGANCVRAVLANGKTVRGCESPQLQCNLTQTLCDTCSGDLCNGGVFPSTRLRCYYCDGRNYCSDVTDERNLQPCAQYSTSDECFEFMNSKDAMIRGCKSDRSLFYECLYAGSNCKLCSGSGCNKMASNRSAELQCHHCSRKDETCSWQQNNDTLDTCRSPVKFASVESCYVRRYTDGSTSRGCSLDDEKKLSAIVGEDFLEQTCQKAGCNDKATAIQKCIQCRADRSMFNTCTTDVETLKGTICYKLLEYGERGCYTRIDGGFIERGCTSDLQKYVLSGCQEDKSCYFCDGMECNRDAYVISAFGKSSSNQLDQTLIRLVLILPFVLLKFLK